MADENVLYPSFQTVHDLPAERILNGALKANLTVVTIIGENAGGDYYASSTGDLQLILWQLEQFKKKLLEGFNEVR